MNQKGLLSKSAKSVKIFLKKTAAFCFKTVFGKQSYPLFGLAQGIELRNKWNALFVPLENPISLTPPKTVEKKLFWKFKNALGEKEEAYSPASVPSLIFIPNGTATRRGGHLTSEGKLITQFFQPLDGKPFKEDALFHLSVKQFFPKITESPEPVVAITSGWQGAFYHWMYEILPRLLLVEESGVPIKKLFIESERPFQKQTLDLLQYNSEILINAAQFDAVRSSELIIPSCSGKSGNPSHWACKLLQKRFFPLIPKNEHSPEKIFISRAKARWRRISNEEEVINFLERRGYKTVILEDLSLIEQMSLFHHAKKIVAPHGAGLSHLVFCRTGTSLLEFFSPSYVLPCYWRISNAVGIDYHYLFGKGAHPPEGHDPHEDPDITIDMAILADACLF